MHAGVVNPEVFDKRGLLETDRLASCCEVFGERFGHFQHCMVVFFVRELTRNLPALTKVELHSDGIRLYNSKAAALVTAASYLRLTFCEQSASNT